MSSDDSSGSGAGNGNGQIDPVAVAALVISLVALLATTGQLLQQYFATADGYRRCQSSVMGLWAKKTRLRWRWRQFRFETLYSTPEFFMTSPFMYPRDGQILLLGDKSSRQLSFMPMIEHSRSITSPDPNYLAINAFPRGDRDELACWLTLLHYLHESTRLSISSEESLRTQKSETGEKTEESRLKWRRVPAIVSQERSWDFQPPDVIRPLAKTTLSTIAILARRMGMRWKDFRPEDGIMRAEGHDHIITSTSVRGLGLVLQYNNTGRLQRLNRPSKWRATTPGSLYKEEDEMYIATSSADRLGAGVVRGHQRLGIPDYNINTQLDIISTLPRLGALRVIQVVKSELRKDATFTFPCGDIVAMTTSMIWQVDSPLVQIPAPSDNMSGFSTSSSGRRAFLNQLFLNFGEGRDASTYSLQSGPTTQSVISQMKRFDEMEPRFAGHRLPNSGWEIRRPPVFLKAVNAAFDECTNLLSKISSYRHLLGNHIHIMMCGMDPAVKPNFKRKISDDDETEVSLETRFALSHDELMADYFGRLPMLIKTFSGNEAEETIDAWVLLMFRAVCWGTCHEFMPGERVPTAYFGSQLPVYIG